MADPLYHFKSQEARYRIGGLLLLSDRPLLTVAAAWGAAEVSWTLPPLDEAPESEGSVWTWLFSGSVYDEESLATAAQVSVHDLRIALRRLKHMRLIYPDGTVTAIVTDLAHAMLTDVLATPDKLTVNRSTDWK